MSAYFFTFDSGVFVTVPVPLFDGELITTKKFLMSNFTDMEIPNPFYNHRLKPTAFSTLLALGVLFLGLWASLLSRGWLGQRLLTWMMSFVNWLTRTASMEDCVDCRYAVITRWCGNQSAAERIASLFLYGFQSCAILFAAHSFYSALSFRPTSTIWMKFPRNNIYGFVLLGLFVFAIVIVKGVVRYSGHRIIRGRGFRSREQPQTMSAADDRRALASNPLTWPAKWDPDFQHGRPEGFEKGCMCWVDVTVETPDAQVISRPSSLSVGHSFRRAMTTRLGSFRTRGAR